MIATDHAPHRVNEKEVEFNYAPLGSPVWRQLSLCSGSTWWKRAYPSGTGPEAGISPAQILGLQKGIRLELRLTSP